MANKRTVEDLLADEVKDLYSAEMQLIKALPKMIKAAADTDLKTALTDHLQETRGHVARLNEVARLLEIKPTGKKCVGMEGVIQEGADVLGEEGDETILDLGIIGAGCRVEHYEMASYLTSISLAERMNCAEAVDLLRETLTEEEAAEKKLRTIAAGLAKVTALKAGKA